MTVNKRECTYATYIAFSIICLTGLLSEAVILQIEQCIYEKNYYKFTITESIVHWAVVCFIWGMVGAFLIYLSARVYKINITNRQNKPSASGVFIIIVAVAAAISLKLLIWHGWKPLQEFYNSGWFQFIFQYVYYMFEMLIVTLTVVFTQQAGEKLFKNSYIPYGGIVLALTWGASHFITQGSPLIALSYVMCALLFGIAFTAAKKNIYIAYPVILIMFLI